MFAVQPFDGGREGKYLSALEGDYSFPLRSLGRWNVHGAV
jgi:hypothetical protein